MKLTTWNIRGTGNRRKQRILSNRIKEEKRDMVFIQETKCSMDKIREIHNKWLIKYEYLEVKADKSAGGILTLWEPHKFSILDVEASRNYLSMICQLIVDKVIHMITNVYGTQKQADKLKLLISLEDLRARHPNMPWIIAGDFNVIRSLSEKKGGIRQLGRDSMAFQNFIMNMGLMDTETINGTFTWNNKRGESSQVSSKLYRFIILEDLILIGPAMTASILPFGGSDH